MLEICQTRLSKFSCWVVSSSSIALDWYQSLGKIWSGKWVVGFVVCGFVGCRLFENLVAAMEKAKRNLRKVEKLWARRDLLIPSRRDGDIEKEFVGRGRKKERRRYKKSLIEKLLS